VDFFFGVKNDESSFRKVKKFFGKTWKPKMRCAIVKAQKARLVLRSRDVDLRSADLA